MFSRAASRQTSVYSRELCSMHMEQMLAVASDARAHLARRDELKSRPVGRRVEATVTYNDEAACRRESSES